jgi:hypothetical protein
MSSKINTTGSNKPRNIALIGASLFFACAMAIGNWIRKL